MMNNWGVLRDLPARAVGVDRHAYLDTDDRIVNMVSVYVDWCVCVCR